MPKTVSFGRTVQGAKRPRGETSRQGAKRLGGETARGRNVQLPFSRSIRGAPRNYNLKVGGSTFPFLSPYSSLSLPSQRSLSPLGKGPGFSYRNFLNNLANLAKVCFRDNCNLYLTLSSSVVIPVKMGHAVLKAWEPNILGLHVLQVGEPGPRDTQGRCTICQTAKMYQTIITMPL